jgi:hypothetical protein
MIQKIQNKDNILNSLYFQEECIKSFFSSKMFLVKRHNIYLLGFINYYL